MRACWRCVALLLFLVPALPARAGMFETATPLKPGHLSFGLQPEVLLTPAEFRFWLEAGVGLLPSTDLTLRFGLVPAFQLGLDLKLGLVRDQGASPGLSVLVGGHGGGAEGGFDLGLVLSKRFGGFGLFTGVATVLDLNPAEVGVYVPLGAAITLARSADLFLEVDLGLADWPNVLAGGLKFYL